MEDRDISHRVPKSTANFTSLLEVACHELVKTSPQVSFVELVRPCRRNSGTQQVGLQGCFGCAGRTFGLPCFAQHDKDCLRKEIISVTGRQGSTASRRRDTYAGLLFCASRLRQRHARPIVANAVRPSERNEVSSGTATALTMLPWVDVSPALSRPIHFWP